MQHHPVAADVAADVAALVAGRDPQRLSAALTETARLRALLPGGPIQALGRADVTECWHDMFAGFDTVEVVESAAEAVVDRLLIHYRLSVSKGATRWICTQTAVCKRLDGLLAVIDLLCSGFREVHDDHDDHDDHDRLAAAPGAGRLG